VAIADAALARSEADAAGFMANPYYVRSQGRAFGRIEAAALYRKGQTADAREAALRGQTEISQGIWALAGVPSYTLLEPSESEAERAYWRSMTLLGRHGGEAARLEEWGKFSEAAQLREALVDLDKRATPDALGSTLIASSAVTLLLAGDLALAETRIREAQANAETRRTEGSPESNAAELVELVDLYGILKTAQDGDMKSARRLFSARSRWIAPSFGVVLEATRRLRKDAPADELIGALALAPEALIRDRIDTRRAAVLAKDDDNKTLFFLIPSVDSPSLYEGLSKQVWRTDRSSMILPKADPAKSKMKMETLFLYGQDIEATLQAYMLHAALLAKARGHEGFVILPIITEKVIAASFVTGAKGEPGLPAPFFNKAEDVIATLSDVIPDPATSKARRVARARGKDK
jgi:hypothetical protein